MRYAKLKEALRRQPEYRMAQAQHAIYKELIEDWQQATSLPLQLREKLNRQAPLKIRARTVEMPDTAKALIQLDDGYTIETVLLKHGRRNTVCVSSQVGCRLACLFCHSGRLEFKRNLSAEEITWQVLYFLRLLKKSRETVNNVVFMGMGEPFLNYSNVVPALKELNSKDRFNISARKISVSTSGIADRIREFSSTGLQVNLAVSLNAPTDDLRSRIMPINKRYPLKTLMDAVKYYISRTNRKVMFEYVMIDGLNDSPEQAEKLIALLGDTLCVVNLIPYNGNGRLKPSSREAVGHFREVLKQGNINVIERQRFGKGIDAACGQLLYRTQTPRDSR
ncbi:MAG: 23S rRNA (adenine(2503)-C(2))-methyltransferase RlmN [Actinomycetota bacterium]